MVDSIAHAFSHCPRCGKPHSEVGQNPFICSECEFTYFFGPVAAVAGIVCNAAGEVLVLRRARNPGKGMLGLPGGFVDNGESAEEALRREVDEEVNLELRNLSYLGSFPNRYEFQGFVIGVCDVFYRAEVDDLSALQLQATEIDAWEFVRPQPQHLEQFAFESNRRALELYLQQT